MVLLGLEQASLLFRQCAAVPRHRLSPRGFFLATRNISWGTTQAQLARRNNRVLQRRRKDALASVKPAKRSLIPPATLDESPKSVRYADPEEQVTLKYFEAEAKDKSNKDQIDIGDLERIDKDLEQEERGVDKRIRDLEEDIKEPFFADIPDDFADDLFGGEEKKKQLIQHISDNWDELGRSPHQVDVWEGLPESLHVFLRNLNGALTEVSLEPSSDQARIQLWRWYSRCKICVPDFLPHVPEEAWQLLWLSQSEDSPHNPNRASHLRLLADDMVKVGRTMDQEQRYSRLEGMFMDSQQEKALEEWEKALQNGDGTVPAFLELGLRMYAYRGNLSRTVELHDLLLAATNDWNRDVFLAVLAVILASNSSKPPPAKQAHDLYVKMRERFRDDLVMEDYDAISLTFLKARQRNLALMVFRDMMLAGDAAEAKSNSFVRQIRGHISSLLNAGKSTDKINAFMLNNITYLPRQYQNKFFFAKWLRKLISMDEVDAAAMVVELMYERGINPDAMHVNGIIGAWLRQDIPETRRKAEDMAWSMIQARLDFVAERREKNPFAFVTAHSVNDVEEKGTRVPVWIARRTPPATLETFNIMMKYHLYNEDFATMRHLRNLLVHAELRMNSVFMNQLLYSELHCRTYTHVWQRFDYMSREVVADVETWICLWEIEKQEIVESSNPHADVSNSTKVRYPRPRQLFARMMEWSDNLYGKHIRDALEDMEVDTYNDILRCFCLTRDLVGAFVAMRTLTHKFKVWPDPSTIRMLILQISKMATVRNRPGKRILTPSKAQVEENVAKTTEVLGVITQYRRDQLEQKGIDFDRDLDESQQAEETLRTLLQFVFTLSKRANSVPTVFQAQLEVATREMGVEYIDANTVMDLAV